MDHIALRTAAALLAAGVTLIELSGIALLAQTSASAQPPVALPPVVVSANKQTPRASEQRPSTLVLAGEAQPDPELIKAGGTPCCD
jgi:hypothetical protein